MALEPVYISISKVDNVRHAYLGLEGTILLFGQRQAATDSELLIPVELIAISESSRFKGRRLIAALLSLLLPLLLFGLSYALVFGFRPTEEAEGTTAFLILTIFLLGMLIAGLIGFLVLLAMFLFRVKTVRLRVEPTGATIEFYKHRKQAAQIDDFLNEIRQRQTRVSESLAGPINRPAGFTKEHSVIPRLAVFLWLSLLPALFTERIPLLVLPAAVLVWFAYRRVQYERQPREYRQAVRCYLRGDYDGAIDVLETLRHRLPEYLPTYFCLVETSMRAGRFDEAFEMMSYLASDYPDVARSMENDIWLFKRIHQRRSQTA